ncbi:MAG TPA: TraR/DksA C4-type zinc finger protein [bacterium]|nr:TraR/DksA C4-type zinc finger protein [bacterium]
MNLEERTQAKTDLLRKKARIELMRRHARDAEDSLGEEREADPLDASASRRDAAALNAVSESEARELERIDAALRRIEDGTWGVCVDCGDSIEPQRRHALPEAAFCRTCERAKEEARVAWR